MKLHLKMLAKICLLALFSFSSFALAQDCPKVAGFKDRNCDGEFRIVFAGDSLVFGIGDSANKNKGGYVLRVAKKLPLVVVQNFGVPGATTYDVIDNLEAGLSGSGSAKQKSFASAVQAADVVIVDVGRNDYFLNDRGQTPQQTFSALRELQSLIKKSGKSENDVGPYTVQAVLMLPNRTDQGVFVKALDSLIFKASGANFTSDLRFDLVSKRLLAGDQIHPSPKGYDAIANTFLTYLKKKIKPNL